MITKKNMDLQERRKNNRNDKYLGKYIELSPSKIFKICAIVETKIITLFCGGFECTQMQYI